MSENTLIVESVTGVRHDNPAPAALLQEMNASRIGSLIFSVDFRSDGVAMGDGSRGGCAGDRVGVVGKSRRVAGVRAVSVSGLDSSFDRRRLSLVCR
ncbi:MAG: hypothetical protein ACR2OG_12920 [Gemmatimonadaceae bacterium]